MVGIVAGVLYFMQINVEKKKIEMRTEQSSIAASKEIENQENLSRNTIEAINKTLNNRFDFQVTCTDVSLDRDSENSDTYIVWGKLEDDSGLEAVLECKVTDAGKKGILLDISSEEQERLSLNSAWYVPNLDGTD